MIKLIKVTHHSGSVDYIPYSKENLKHREDHLRFISKEKASKSSVEVVEVEDEEAESLGFITVSPKAVKRAKLADLVEQQAASNAIMLELMKQNQELMQVLLKNNIPVEEVAKEEVTEETDTIVSESEESKPTKAKK